MTNGAKIGIIIGSFTLLVCGGVGIYFLTRGTKANSSSDTDTDSTGTGTGTDTTSKSNIQKATDTINDGIGLASALKDLGSALGIGKNKNKTTSTTTSTTTEVPSAVSALASGKTLKNVYKDATDDNTKLYAFTDGTYVKLYSDGTAKVITKFVESDWTKLSANGEKLNALAMSKEDAKKKFAISKNGILIIK